MKRTLTCLAAILATQATAQEIQYRSPSIVQESYQLIAANAVSPAKKVFGGSYVFSQTCTNYNSGSLTLRVVGPDGSTLQTVITKTASDSTGGTAISLGNNVTVSATLPSGGTGCNALLTRVPQ